MKKIIITIILSSFLLAGNIYFSFDVQNNFKYHSDFQGDIDYNNSFDDGAILLGYDHTVYQQDQFMLNLGFSFSIKSAHNDNDVDDSNTKTDFYSFYIMPNFQLSEKLNLWTTLGYNSSSTTREYALKDGLMYGVGIRVLLTEYIGLGLGYNVHNAETEYTFISEMVNLKIKRLSLDLFYKFN